MTSSTGGFELRGSDSDETRLLVHPIGYAIAVPGHPRLAGQSSAQAALVALADARIELGLRLDDAQTTVSPDSLVSSLLLAHAQSRAADPASLKSSVLDGRLLAPGAAVGMRVNYALRGDDASAMEFVAITAKPASSTIHALHLTVRYRKGDTTPFAWSNLRAALLAHQSWTPGALPALPIWPDSALASRSAKLELSPAATQEARRKAEQVGAVSREEVGQLADLLLASANTDDAPSTPWHPFLSQMTSQKVAGCVSARVAEVLLRDLPEVKTMHDFRAWCWECYWAVGNRAELQDHA